MAATDKRNKKLPMGPVIGIIGWVTALSAAGVGTVLILYDVASGHASPYTGVLTYMLTPVFLFGGLGLVFWAWILKLRRKSRHESRLILDMGNPKHRNRIKVLGLGATMLVCLSAVGGYRSYHFTESTQFCGVACHEVMQPEYDTFKHSPHAKVSCVECHIGNGAEWYVKAKMSGLRQVQAYMTSTYHLPIETPVKGLRPARDTCEECHWPIKFSGNLERTYTHYQRDEENTPYSVTMLLKVGGGGKEEASGIHWHVSGGHKIEYIATDPKRTIIPWVRMTDPEGNEEVFTDEEFDPEILEGTHEIRVMDCLDCHNRPAHIFENPGDQVDLAMRNGKIDVSLPSVKDTIMTAMEESYSTVAEAHEALDAAFQETYEEEIEDSDVAASVDRALQAAKEIYSLSFFPEHNVNWATHPDFGGHYRWNGCYRCHDGLHESEEGEAISHSCENCHTIIQQGEGFDNIADMVYGATDFYHPMDMGELDEGDKCTDCHEAPDPTDFLTIAEH